VALCCAEGGERVEKELKELLEQSIEERAQIVFSQIRQAAPQLNEKVEKIAGLSMEVEHCGGISEEAKDLIQRFMSESAEADAEFQKLLYIQGARDCVTILRELSVIK